MNFPTKKGDRYKTKFGHTLTASYFHGESGEPFETAEQAAEYEVTHISEICVASIEYGGATKLYNTEKIEQ